MRRERPEHPVLAVGAVVFKDGQVLLARRGKEPGYGDWTLPGGVVQYGETMHDAIAREVYEETGLKVRPVKLLKVFDRIIRRNGTVLYHYVLVDFLCVFQEGTIRPATDVLDASWVSIDRLERYRVPRWTREFILESFRLHAGQAAAPLPCPTETARPASRAVRHKPSDPS